MTARSTRLRVLVWFSAAWRCQRGFGIGEALVLAALIAAGYATYEAMSKKVPALQAALIPLKQCNTTVKAAIEGLQCTYGTYEVDGNCNSKFLGFPAGLEVPPNDAAIVALQSCKAELDKLTEIAKQGNHKAINQLSGQIDSGLALAGKCEITSTFKQGTAGVDYKDSFTAHIPFAGSAQHTGTVAVGGAASGSGAFRPNPSDPKNWIGDVRVSGASNQNAGGQDSQVTATATTPAVGPKNDDGSCPGASIKDGNQCILIVRPDGTCPAGLTPNGGRCDFSCTTPAASIHWKAPDPVKIVSFIVSPNLIEKGSKDPVTLHWVLNHAAAASIDQGIGSVGPVDATKAGLTGSWTIVPTPTESTTFTLSAFGLNQTSSDSKAVTLTVKETATGPFTVAIGTPNPNEEITDQGVTVSGVIAPVPDAAHRKAQILVNGAFLSEATINDAGQFSTRTALMNTIGFNDLSVSAFSVTVTECGSIAAPVFMSANKPSAKNLIQVRVPVSDNAAATASVEVEHVVFVSDFHVRWGGDCPGPPQDEVAQVTIRNGAAAQTVGYVQCGFSGPAHCTATTATIQIGTSVGSGHVNQSWFADIDQCN
jgi:hypothetical protein